MEKLLQLDENILLWIQDNLRIDFLDWIMKTITGLGDGGFIWIILTALLLLFRKTRFAGATSALSMILTLLVVNLGIKNIVARTRPYEAIEGLERIIEAQSDFSFPSGHTAHSFAVAVVLFMLLPKKWGITTLVFAFIMGFTRLYVGVHYPTDVIGGALIGTVIAIISLCITRYIRNKLWPDNPLQKDEKIDEI